MAEIMEYIVACILICISVSVMRYIIRYVMPYRKVKCLGTFENDFADIKSRVVAHNSIESGSYVLSEKDLELVNKGRYDNDNNLLLQAVLMEQREAVEFLLKVRDLKLNYRNKNGKTAADMAWERKDYQCLLSLLRKDSRFPVDFSLEGVDVSKKMGKEVKRFAEERAKLHLCIDEGDIDYIKSHTRRNESSKYYSPGNKTALSHCLWQNQHKIYAYLISIGLKFGIEEWTLDVDDCNPQDFANALEEFYEHHPDSHLHRLFSNLKYLGKPSEIEDKVIQETFLYLNGLVLIQNLLKVIEHEEFELILDMITDSLGRIRIEGGDEIAGLTEHDGRITIGGENCLPNKDHKSVYGTFAHEICHLAMSVTYRNGWKPYPSGDEKRKDIYLNICKDIHSLYKEDPMKLDIVIRIVFDGYGDERVWPDELIVRVPEIIAKHGEEEGRKILQKQVPDLLNFYVEYIQRDCAEHSQSRYFVKPLRKIKQLCENHTIVPGVKNEASLFVRIEDYKDCVIPYENISLLPTSVPRLCALHLFHQLKQESPIQAEKKYLVFDLQVYSEHPEIHEAYETEACRKLILFAAEGNSNWKKISEKFTKKMVTDKKEAILVASPESLKQHLQLEVKKFLTYDWDDLTKSFQNFLLKKEINFQGKQHELEEILKNVAKSKVIIPEILNYIVSNENLVLGESLEKESSLYEEQLYLQRSFLRREYVDCFKNVEASPYKIFVTGLTEEKVNEFITKMDIVQRIDSIDDLQNKKSIIIPKDESVDVMECFSKITERAGKSKSTHWVHFGSGKFYLRESKGNEVEILRRCRDEAIREENIVYEMRKERVVVVADDPGTGKSTSANSLMKRLKDRNPNAFVKRINLSDLCDSSDSLSLTAVSEFSSDKEILEYFLKILKLTNPLEEKVIKSLQSIAGGILVIFDGFDEISPDFIECTEKLLKTLLNSTQVQMWIFSRRHERLHLEVAMNVVSFSLRPFSREDQSNYLMKFWKREFNSFKFGKKNLKARFEEMKANLEEKNSEECTSLLNSIKELIDFINNQNEAEFREKINNMDFTDFSKMVVNNIRNNIPEEEVALPLCLHMMAQIVLLDNLKIPTRYEKYLFYSDFLNMRVDYFLRIKCQMISEGKYIKKAYEDRQNQIFRNLEKFSDRIFRPEMNKLPMEEGKLEVLFDVGLLRKDGEDYHFSHMTFAEYFFSRVIVNGIEKDLVDSQLISKVLLQKRYREVRIFLDGFFKTAEADSVSFSTSILENLDVPTTYIKYLDKQRFYDEWKECYDTSGFYVWRKILKDCEMNLKEFKSDDFVRKIANYMKNDGDVDNDLDYVKVFKFLGTSLNDEFLFKLLDSHFDSMYRNVFETIEDDPLSEISEILSVFKRILAFKKSHLEPSTTSVDDGKGNVKVGLNMFEIDDEEDCRNIFSASLGNRSANVFLELLRFAESFMEREAISKSVIKVFKYCPSLICNNDFVRECNIINYLEELRRILGEDAFSECFLSFHVYILHHLATRCNTSEYFLSTFEYIKGIVGGELLEKLFPRRICDGDSILVSAVQNGNFEIFETVLNLAGNHLKREEMTELIHYRNIYGVTLIHCKQGPLSELASILKDKLEEKVLLDLLTARDDDGCTHLHHICKVQETEVILSDFHFYLGILGEASLRDFLLAKDCVGNTFLKVPSMRSKEFDITKIFPALQSMLPRSLYEELLDVRNDE